MKSFLQIVYFVFKAVTSLTLGFIVLMYYFYLKFKFRNTLVLSDEQKEKLELVESAYTRLLSLNLEDSFIDNFCNKL